MYLSVYVYAYAPICCSVSIHIYTYRYQASYLGTCSLWLLLQSSSFLRAYAWMSQDVFSRRPGLDPKPFKRMFGKSSLTSRINQDYIWNRIWVQPDGPIQNLLVIIMRRLSRPGSLPNFWKLEFWILATSPKQRLCRCFHRSLVVLASFCGHHNQGC